MKPGLCMSYPVHGQTLAQVQLHLRRHLREGELRLCPRINKINEAATPPAPIVDTASHEQLVLSGVRLGGAWRFISPPRTNRASKAAESRGGWARVGLHRDVAGANGLDDHFLDVTIALLQLPYSTQSIDALTKCLANTNEDPGSKRDV